MLKGSNFALKMLMTPSKMNMTQTGSMTALNENSKITANLSTKINILEKKIKIALSLSSKSVKMISKTINSLTT